MRDMELVRYEKRTIAGLITGYNLPASHPLAHLGIQYTPSDGGWHFVFLTYIKPKTLSEAEMSAEYLQGIADFLSASAYHELMGTRGSEEGLKEARTRMYAVTRLTFGIDCYEEGF